MHLFGFGGLEHDAFEAMLWLNAPTQARFPDAERFLAMANDKLAKDKTARFHGTFGAFGEFALYLPSDMPPIDEASKLMSACIAGTDVSARALYVTGLVGALQASRTELKPKKRTAHRATAFGLFQRAADLGSVPALCALAYCAALGHGTAVDPAQAVRLWQQASAADSMLADFNLALCYQGGMGTKRDIPQSMTLWRAVAARGVAAVQFRVGIFYRDGTHMAKDPTEALRLFRLAAAQGYYLAQDALVELGEAPPASGTVRSEFARMLAHHTVPELITVAEGAVARGEHELAVNFYRAAARLGDLDALAVLGDYEHHGFDRPDLRAAVRLWRAGALRGHARSQYELARACLSGSGVAKDPAEAVRLFRQAAKQRHPDAQHSLALCYHEGTGAAHDPAVAFTWWQRAAKAGHAEAMRRLSACYASGAGVTRDHRAAAKWLEAFARLRDDGAPILMVDMRGGAGGTGPDPALMEAFRRTRAHAAEGDAESQLTMAIWLLSGKVTALDVPAGMRMLRLASAQGHANAQFILGSFYMTGQGTACDPAEGMRWLVASAKQGHEGAIKMLALYPEKAGTR
jgi:TPR repeat protein